MRRIALAALAVSIAAFGSATHAARAQDVAGRTLTICVAADAPPAVRQAAHEALAAAKTQPLLRVLSGATAPTTLTDSAVLMAAPPTARAYNNLVLIGMPDDPLIQQAWQREAMVEANGCYIYGFGHLRGDIGYIESDRNPFLHGSAIKTAPYETEVVTLTGSTPAGVALAVRAFLRTGLVNGVVGVSGNWSRPDTTLLDRDPLSPDFTLPDWIPTQVGGAVRIGITQASEEEYRGVLADTGREPQTILRIKYHHADDWDGTGAKSALSNYSAGLHRRAYGETLWCAKFASPQAATAAAPKIAAAAKLTLQGTAWGGEQGTLGTFGGSDPRPLTLWQQGEWLLMSTLPGDDTAALRERTVATGPH